VSKKVQILLSEDIKKLNIKPLSDSELTKLLHQAKYGQSELERRQAKNKIVLHILPIIIAKCKKYFAEDFLIENTDFINEVVLYLLESAIDNYRLEEQKGERCALFFTLVNYAILLAYRRLKRKQFGTPDIKGLNFINPLAREFQDTNVRLEEDYYVAKTNKKERKDDTIDFNYYFVLEDKSEDVIKDELQTTELVEFTGEDYLMSKETFKYIYQNVLPERDLLTNIYFFVETGNFYCCNSGTPDYAKFFKRLNLDLSELVN